MPSRLSWTRQARLDLLDIYELIGIEHSAAAERYFDRIELLTNLLREQPRLGVSRHDMRPASGCWWSALT
jgi:toxin ParE1/3/4